MTATLRSLTLTALTVVGLSLLFTSVAIGELQYDPGLMRNPPRVRQATLQLLAKRTQTANAVLLSYHRDLDFVRAYRQPRPGRGIRAVTEADMPKMEPVTGDPLTFHELLDRQMKLDATANMTCGAVGDFAVEEMFMPHLPPAFVH